MPEIPEIPESAEFTATPEETGERLDVFLAKNLPLYSRVLLRKAITAGGVTLSSPTPRKMPGAKPSYRLKGDEIVRIVMPELPRQSPIPEDIPIDVLYEDEYFAAVNKPPGMVVHPARGNWSGTLVAALAFHFENLSEIGGTARPGIVHRLDRDTSGAILVAKNDIAHAKLADLFQKRTITKEYVALTQGTWDRDADVVNEPLAMHPHHREKMAIRRDDPNARDARTVFEVAERLGKFTLVHCKPKTGRTHQIRVHLAHLGHPVVCDKLYGGQKIQTIGEVTLERQALHARRLFFVHPITEKEIEINAPLTQDIQQFLDALKQ